MKRIIMIFAVMAAVLSSCTKNEIEPVLGNEDKDIVLNISVSDPGADTKALIKTGWAENDEISIWYDTNTGVNPDLVITYNGTQWIKKEDADLSGKNPSTGTGKYAKSLYNGTVKVASKDDYTFENNKLTFNIANWVFLTEVQVVVKGLTGGSADKNTLACDKFTPITGSGYTVGTNDITASNGTKASAVTGISNTDGVAFVFATADYSATAADYKFALTDNTSSPAVTKVYTANTSKINGTAGSMTAIKALTIADDKFKAPVIPEFVDFDLTSGLKWRSWNLGATKPEEYGAYFSWGETGDGRKPSFEKSFDWTNDIFGQTFNKIEQAEACPSGVLAQTYDAAYQTNNSWRMPTTEDFVNLFKGCYAEWGTYMGVNGLIVYKAKSAEDKGYAYFRSKMNQYSGSGNTWNTTDKTRPSYSTDFDTFVFFPAAGYGYGADLDSAGSDGLYWSSSLWSSPSNAYDLCFDGSNVNPQDGVSRYYGCSVRPVSD